MLALARKIVSRDEEDAGERVEEVFAQARGAEASAEEYLVDDAWKAVELEPGPEVVVEAHRNEVCGTRADAGLVMDNSEAVEAQRSLFSWTEFLAGEQGRRRKHRPVLPQPAGLSAPGAMDANLSSWGGDD